MSIKRYSPLHSIAAAAAATATVDSTAIDMYSRSYFRGGRPQGRRGFSDKSSGPERDPHPEIVSGDSHFHSVRDANRGFRSLNSSTLPNYNAVPPPQQYFTGQHFYGPGPQRGTPVWQQFSGPRPYADHNQRSHRPPPRQAEPPFGNNQQFREPRVQPPSRPRASKPPDYRDWEFARPGPPPHCERFTVLSYNLLADYLAFDHWHKLYSHIPRYILDWSWRKRNISFELGLWSADIMCFQEVDRFQDIEAELRLRGYSGIWKMRTGDPVDGCATFWRVSRFKLLSEESIEYNKLGLRDNVAQICVFESLSGKTNSNDQFATSTSLENSNRVVVCNIHVLFNPKRGDIKLGQIRVLLERALAISKLWDDAPVVICGDFNCTPMSPVYNFILEQKLDLSELPRDKVSGQASAEIHLSRPSYPDFRMRSNDDSTQVSSANPKKPEQGGVPSAYLNDSRKELPIESHSIPKCSVLDETFGSCNSENVASGRANQLPDHDAYSFGGNSMLATQRSSPGIMNESFSIAQDEAGSPISPGTGTNHKYASLESCSEDIHSQATDNRHNESELANFTDRISLSRSCVESDTHTSPEAPDDQNNNFVVSHCSGDSKTSEATETSDSDVSPLEGLSDDLPPNFHVSLPESQEVVPSVSVVNDTHDNLLAYRSTLCESTSSDFLLDQKLESLSLNESLNETKDDNFSKDCDSFLSELHGSGHNPFDDLNPSSQSQNLNSRGDEILNDTLDVNHEAVVDGGKFSCISSTWTPMEIQTATGSADCKVVEHSLKLRSAYSEVQDSSGLRDSNGEPLVTSYHRRFLGTVDYIWLSEGLQASKVLAPIPKHVMQQTLGFPTKKWGSDHIALVSELAFTKDKTSENSSR